MAERALWLSSKRIDAATLVASSEEGTLVVGYLQDRRPEKKHRFTGCTAEYYTFDFGQDVACNALALVGHNLSAAATLRLRLAASAANVTAAPVTDPDMIRALLVDQVCGTVRWRESVKTLLPNWMPETE